MTYEMIIVITMDVAAIAAAAYAAYAAWRAQLSVRDTRSASLSASQALAASWRKTLISLHAKRLRTSGSPSASNSGNDSSCMADIDVNPNVELTGGALAPSSDRRERG
jgi:hypothetical protein